MNDENRMAPLPPEVGRLLEAERSRPRPAPDVTDRMYGRLALVVGLPGPGGPDGSGGSAPPDPPAGAGIASGGAAAAAAQAGIGSSGVAVTIAFVVGAIGGSVATHLLHQQGEVSSPITTRAVAQPSKRANNEIGQLASPREPAAVAASALPKAEVSPRKPTVSKTQRSIDREPTSANLHDKQLAAERALVERARSALIRSQPADALAAVEQHRKDFPAGKLAEEREAIHVLALVADGESDNARRIARRFRNRYPESFLLPAIDAALAARPRQRADREKPANLQ